MMRLAVLSDIHGNIFALDAVLKDIAVQGAELIINLGDIVSGGLCPAETADRLMPLNFPTIKGNHERQLLESDPQQMSLSDKHAYQQLTPEHWQWLKQMPTEMTLENEILMVHGIPGDDRIYLAEEVTESGVRPASAELLAQRLQGHTAPVILCGHTHIPRCIKRESGQLIVNPGSVGLQAYDDDRPFPHKMESGSPEARYAILEKKNHQWQVELRKVGYDYQQAANIAIRNKREDWVNALRMGRM